MDHFDLEPVERLVEAVADLQPGVLQTDVGEIEFGAAQWVERLAASDEVEFFIHAYPSGITRKLDPEMATGRVGFMPLFAASCIVYINESEPFGAHWPDPSYSTLREWLDIWRDSHGLDSPPTALHEFLFDSESHAEAEELVVVTPIYLVTLQRADLQRAEALVRDLHVRLSDIDPLDRPRRDRARPTIVETADSTTLTSAELARMMGVTDWTVRKWRRFGDGPPSHKTGATLRAGVYYLRSEVEAWMRSRDR